MKKKERRVRREKLASSEWICTDPKRAVKQSLAAMGKDGEPGGSTGIELEIFEHEVEELVPVSEDQITGQGIQVVEEGLATD